MDEATQYRIESIAQKMDRLDQHLDRLEARLLEVERSFVQINTGFKIMLWLGAGVAAILTGWDKIVGWLNV